MKASLVLLGLGLACFGSAQFVFPKTTYHNGNPDAYTEDAFVNHYRTEFFAVFKGDIPRFHKAFAEVEAMVKKNPKDAQAMVWYGNGLVIEAGLKMLSGKKDEGLVLWKSANKSLDTAVKLDPSNYNIYMVRTASLVVGTERYPKEWIDSGTWKRVREDCLKFIKSMGPDRLAQTSIHMRGETYGCLGLAYAHLGDRRKAAAAFERVIALDPGTDYEVRAKKELAALGA